MLLLGIDIGTTKICGLLYDTNSKSVIKTISKPNDSFIISDKEYEKIQDPQIIKNTVFEIIDEIGIKPDSIGFSCQMHGIVYLDESLNTVSPLYIWQDSRGALEYKDNKTYAEYLGCYSGYGLSTAFYNRVNNIEPDNAKFICTIGDYIIADMCNLKKPVTHITNAAGLGCFNLELNKFDLDFDLLPEICVDFSVVGYTDDNIPISVCLGDNQAGFIGSVPDKEGALLNIGTGAQISYLTDVIDKQLSAEIRPFDGKRYLMAGCSLCGGRAFAIFEKFCREISILAGAQIDSYYPVLDKLLSDFSNTDLIADCRFCGTRDNPLIKGGFSQLSESNFNVKDFAVSILDGMINELYGMYDKKSDRTVYCSGNGIRKNPILSEIILKYFGTRPKSTVHTEEAAFGAALSAGVAVGFYKNIDEARSQIIIN